jgi:polyisoprenyl-teichoic acid--peptidoglycan teichoic acid transferase
MALTGSLERLKQSGHTKGHTCLNIESNFVTPSGDGEKRLGKHSARRPKHNDPSSRAKRDEASAPEGASVYKSRRRRYRLVMIFAIAIVLVVTIVYAKPIAKLAARVYLSFKISKSHLTGKEGADVQKALTSLSKDPDKSVNTLVMGSDAGSMKGEGGYCRSDVMLLVCLQERDRKAVVISIPRDTMVQIAGHGTQKINAAHAFGGPSGAIAAVKDLLGLDVHHYISMQFTGFEKIVNALGGVPMHLSKPINDPHSGYLPAGDLNLDGWQALVLVRSRNADNGDLDRIESQHSFIKALMVKAEQMKSVWKANQLVNIVASNCKMDYTAGQLMDLALELRGFNAGNVQLVTVPGSAQYISGVSYFVSDPKRIARMSAQVDKKNWISNALLAELKGDGVSRAVMYVAPDADVVTVLSGSNSSASAVPIVVNELKLLGHELVNQGGKSKQPLARTTVYYRPEAEANAHRMVKYIPELENADFQESQEAAQAHNSPVVIVLGSKFKTPSLVSLYGRISTPALDIETFGEKVHSFNEPARN